jgi:hypothetical protein
MKIRKHKINSEGTINRDINTRTQNISTSYNIIKETEWNTDIEQFRLINSNLQLETTVTYSTETEPYRERQMKNTSN